MRRLKEWYDENKQYIPLYLYLASYIIIAILAVIIGILIAIYKFSNPELTDTQIFIYSWENYWWLYILIIAFAIVGCIGNIIRK